MQAALEWSHQNAAHPLEVEKLCNCRGGGRCTAKLCLIIRTCSSGLYDAPGDPVRVLLRPSQTRAGDPDDVPASMGVVGGDWNRNGGDLMWWTQKNWLVLVLRSVLRWIDGWRGWRGWRSTLHGRCWPPLDHSSHRKRMRPVHTCEHAIDHPCFPGRDPWSVRSTLTGSGTRLGRDP